MLPQYRAVVVIIGLVALVATYNYVRFFESWNQAYTIVDGAVHANGGFYNDIVAMRTGC